MVDVSPYSGDYKGVVVTNNTIAGGFATSSDTGSATKGTNNEDVIIKYGQPPFFLMSHEGADKNFLESELQSVPEPGSGISTSTTSARAGQCSTTSSLAHSVTALPFRLQPILQ